MIIRQEHARNLNVERLAEMATEYGQEFTRLLGYDAVIGFGADNVMFECADARKRLLNRYESRLSDADISDEERNAYNVMCRTVDAKDPFTIGMMAFIPLGDLSREEKYLVNVAFPSHAGLRGCLWDKITKFNERKEGRYATLNGFGSEIGHLVAGQIFHDRHMRGMYEAFDVCSQMLEMSRNIRFLATEPGFEGDAELLETRFHRSGLRCIRATTAIYETLLFEGESPARDQIKRIKRCNEVSAAVELESLKQEYVETDHYMGGKLFVELYDAAGQDMEQTYRLMGDLFADPCVIDMASALQWLGHSGESVVRYANICKSKRIERAACLKRSR